jgi:hypothetical protein
MPPSLPSDREIYPLFPALVHILDHLPDVSPQWRCEALLSMNDDTQVLSFLDVLPATFARLLETLTDLGLTR